MGDIDRQTVLPFGTPAEVEAYVRLEVATLGAATAGASATGSWEPTCRPLTATPCIVPSSGPWVWGRNIYSIPAPPISEVKPVMKCICRDKIIHRFSRDIPPVIEVDPGEEILFEVLDASNGKVKTSEDAADIARTRNPEKVESRHGPGLRAWGAAGRHSGGGHIGDPPGRPGVHPSPTRQRSPRGGGGGTPREGRPGEGRLDRFRRWDQVSCPSDGRSNRNSAGLGRDQYCTSRRPRRQHGSAGRHSWDQSVPAGGAHREPIRSRRRSCQHGGRRSVRGCPGGGWGGACPHRPEEG